MFFKKKDSHVNIYEAHADERLYDLWAERDRLVAKTCEVITRKAVIDIYPDGADRDAAIKECEKAKRSLLCAIGAYDTSRMEYNDYITKNAERFDNPRRPWTTTSHDFIAFAYRTYFKNQGLTDSPLCDKIRPWKEVDHLNSQKGSYIMRVTKTIREFIEKEVSNRLDAKYAAEKEEAGNRH